MRYLQRLALRGAIVVMLSVTAQAAWAQDINRDLLRKGMGLNDVVQTFGQPNHMEWANVKGTPVLFIFYPTDKSDAVFRVDGSMWLPLGFVTEVLAGWGREYYEEIQSAQGRSDK